MQSTKLLVALTALIAVGTIMGCQTSAKSPDVSETIRKSLDQAGFKDVSVAQDRDKGIVTLGGKVATQSDKARAETLAQSLAAGQVVADQIAVTPVGAGKETAAVNSDLDEGIEKNLDAVLIQNKMHDLVKYAVKNGVVTLTGQVNSEVQRTGAQQMASAIPNVLQVVNALDVIKSQKATSSL
jgi:osmotically-inducible protein OsmY